MLYCRLCKLRYDDHGALMDRSRIPILGIKQEVVVRWQISSFLDGWNRRADPRPYPLKRQRPDLVKIFYHESSLT